MWGWGLKGGDACDMFKLPLFRGRVPIRILYRYALQVTDNFFAIKDLNRSSTETLQESQYICI